MGDDKFSHWLEKRLEFHAGRLVDARRGFPKAGEQDATARTVWVLAAIDKRYETATAF